MKNLGMSAFWIGIIIAMIAAAKNPLAGAEFSDQIPMFSGGSLLAIAGIVLWRKGLKAANSNNVMDSLSIEDITMRLRKAADKLSALKSFSFDSVSQDVDNILDLIEEVVESRDSLSHHLSLEKSAMIVSDLAVTERKLNRIWSMVTDGHRNKGDIEKLFQEASHNLDSAISSL